ARGAPRAGRGTRARQARLPGECETTMRTLSERFEGGSDPDDMAIIYALESASGLHGTLVDAFGVYSNPAISAYLGRVRLVGTNHVDRPNPPVVGGHRERM